MHKLSQREQAEKARKNPVEEDPEFQIAPMIDILLVLLVFFMSISSTEVLQANHAITLPVAADGKDAGKNPGQVIINIAWVAMNSIGSIDINDRKYPDPASIVPVLQSAIAANPVARVLIRADRQVRWDYMKTVMRAIGQAGVANVTFSVTNKDTSPGH